MAKIQVDGTEYRVLDNLGYQSSAGVYAKEVDTPAGPKMAVRYPGQKLWRFWAAKDRIRPMGRIVGQAEN